ncbi:DUF3954 domain-containing protein [Cytobacillus sp. Hm23]
MKINTKNKTVDIDLTKDATYAVKDGEIKLVDPPKDGHGEQVITWQNGKPHVFKLSYTKRI